jgi:hypothetical protein
MTDDYDFNDLIRQKTVLTDTEETPVEIKTQQDEMAKTLRKMLSGKIYDLLRVASIAKVMDDVLGSSNEMRFIVPHQIDKGGMPSLGLECVETDGYDLKTLTDPPIRISSKKVKSKFHNPEKNGGIRQSYKLALPFGKTRNGSTTKVPICDVLLLVQLSPYVVCGVAPMHRIREYIKEEDAGTDLKNVPFDLFDYVLHYIDRIETYDIPSPIKSAIEEWARLTDGGMMQDCLKKFKPTKGRLPSPTF